MPLSRSSFYLEKYKNCSKPNSLHENFCNSSIYIGTPKIGDLALRFCYWERKPDRSRGRFRNVAMFVYDHTLEDLRDEAKKHKADIILMLLRKFAG